MMRRSRGSARARGERLFFATDIHGSERCFRKFLNAGKAYEARLLVLGGDMTGKTLIPIQRTARGWSADVNDHAYTDLTEHERQALEQRIRDWGQYPIVGEYDELAALADENVRDAAFSKAVVESMTRWADLAQERLGGTGIRCFVAPGNDDFWEIDEPLRAATALEFVEGRRVRVSDEHEMITTGQSNRTPWNSPRELDEPVLGELLEEMFAQVEDPERLIAVIHPPPYQTRLDRAPALDENFSVRRSGGEPVLTSVGSTAVRAFITDRQPMLSLHGHVHESRGIDVIGRTTCINPGSEYQEGTLLGVIVTLNDGRVASHQLVTG